MEDKREEDIHSAACGQPPTRAGGHYPKEAAALGQPTGPYFLTETVAHAEKPAKEQVFWWELQCVRDHDGTIHS